MEAEDVAGVVQRREMGFVNTASKGDAAGARRARLGFEAAAQRAIADDNEARVNRRHRAEQHVDAFLRDQPPDKQQERRSARLADGRGADENRRGAGEWRGVDPVWMTTHLCR